MALIPRPGTLVSSVGGVAHRAVTGGVRVGLLPARAAHATSRRLLAPLRGGSADPVPAPRPATPGARDKAGIGANPRRRYPSASSRSLVP